MRLFSPAEMLQITNKSGRISVEQHRGDGGGGVMAWRRLGWPAAGAGAEDGQPALSLRAPSTQCAPVQLLTCISAISHGVHLFTTIVNKCSSQDVLFGSPTMYTVRKEIFEHRLDCSDMLNYIQVCIVHCTFCILNTPKRSSLYLRYPRNIKCIRLKPNMLRQAFKNTVHQIACCSLSDEQNCTLIEKKIKFSSYIKIHSSYMWKYLRISSYIRKPFLIYDFATAPL
jgi:hypothetical protein